MCGMNRPDASVAGAGSTPRRTLRTHARASRGPASRRRRGLGLLTVLTLAAPGLAAAPAQAAPAAGAAPSAAAPSSSQPASQPVSAPAARVDRSSTVYAAVASSGTRRTLQLVSRRTGKVVKVLASGRASDWQEPFRDVDVASDGSVWAVVVDRRLPGQYGTVLVRYDAAGAHRVLPYATSVRVSPSARTVAVTVLSPDGDGDGRGLEAVRVIRRDGRLVKTLVAQPFPVGSDGSPQAEVGGMNVAGWVSEAQLAVGSGCCDSGGVSIVSATAPTRRPVTFWGNGGTRAIGVRGSAVLVQRPREAGNGNTVPFHLVALDGYWVSRARPAGVRVIAIPGEDLDPSRYVDAMNRRAGATPWVVGAKRFPYRGTGRVVAAYV